MTASANINTIRRGGNSMTKPLRSCLPLIAAALLFAALVLPGRVALAQCANSCDSGCVISDHNATREFVSNQHFITRRHMTQEMTAHQRWWFTEFFNEYILPAQMMMAEQLVAVGIQQMEILGALFDAKHQLESQAIFHELTARAHKDYHSSHGMCTIATAARGLAAVDRRAETTAFVLSRRSMARQLGARDVSAADGPVIDRATRVEQFIRRFCDTYDSNSALVGMCQQRAPTATINKDIDYNRLIETPMTLDIDFTEGDAPEGDEEDVMAFAANIFAHQVFSRIPEAELAILSNQELYLDLRSVVAKRSVAENSFYHILGMKARGSEEAEEAAGHIGVVLQQLGVPDEEIFLMLGDRPSYYALMDVMAQKIYQRPEFFTDLYDKPANVARKDVAMQAIDLMVDRDIYKSDLRTEAMLAVLLELELMQHQRRVQNRINDLRAPEGLAAE